MVNINLFNSLFCALLVLLIVCGQHLVLTQPDFQFLFPYCNCRWYIYQKLYDIDCNETMDIVRGNSIKTEIRYFTITNISSFPINTFANLSISFFKISNYSLSSYFFDSLLSLVFLYLYDMPSLNQIETDCFRKIRFVQGIYNINL